jgi:hypothetical protein
MDGDRGVVIAVVPARSAPRPETTADRRGRATRRKKLFHPIILGEDFPVLSGVKVVAAVIQATAEDRRSPAFLKMPGI